MYTARPGISRNADSVCGAMQPVRVAAQGLVGAMVLAGVAVVALAVMRSMKPLAADDRQ